MPRAAPRAADDHPLAHPLGAVHVDQQPPGVARTGGPFLRRSLVPPARQRERQPRREGRYLGGRRRLGSPVTTGRVAPLAGGRSSWRSRSSRRAGRGRADRDHRSPASSRRSPSPASCSSVASLLDLLADTTTSTPAISSPYLVLLGVLLMLSRAQPGGRRPSCACPLGEQVHRRTMDEILDVATEVDLEAYERRRVPRPAAAGHDAPRAGSPSAVVFGLVTIVSTLVVTIGVVAVLFTVAPILVPIALLGYVPDRPRQRPQQPRPLPARARADRAAARALVPRVPDDRARRGQGGPRVRHRADAAAVARRAVGRRAWPASATLVRRRLVLTIARLVGDDRGARRDAVVRADPRRAGSITIGDAAVAIVGLQQLSGRLQSAGERLQHRARGRHVPARLRDVPGDAAGDPRAAPDGRAAGAADACSPSTSSAIATRVPPRTPCTTSASSCGAARSWRSSAPTARARRRCPSCCASSAADRAAPFAWDGVDLAAAIPILVRAQIAPVFQDYARYLLTFRQAIGLGDVDRLDDEAAIRARRRAGRASTT